MNPLDRYYKAKRASNASTEGLLGLCQELQTRRDLGKTRLTSPQTVDYRSNQTATLLETANVP